MDKKKIFTMRFVEVLVITGVIFFLNACNASSDSSDGNDEFVGEPCRPINFSENTVKQINYERLSVSFTADRKDFWVANIWESIGTEIIEHAFPYDESLPIEIISRVFSYDERFQPIEGDWYDLKIEKNTLNIDIYENNSDKERILMVNVLAGACDGSILIIKQTTK